MINFIKNKKWFTLFLAIFMFASIFVHVSRSCITAYADDTNYQAQIGSVKYTTLSGALNAASSGQTIEIINENVNFAGATTATLKSGVTIKTLDSRQQYYDSYTYYYEGIIKATSNVTLGIYEDEEYNTKHTIKFTSGTVEVQSGKANLCGTVSATGSKGVTIAKTTNTTNLDDLFSVTVINDGGLKYDQVTTFSANDIKIGNVTYKCGKETKFNIMDSSYTSLGAGSVELDNDQAIFVNDAKVTNVNNDCKIKVSVTEGNYMVVVPASKKILVGDVEYTAGKDGMTCVPYAQYDDKGNASYYNCLFKGSVELSSKQTIYDKNAESCVENTGSSSITVSVIEDSEYFVGNVSVSANNKVKFKDSYSNEIEYTAGTNGMVCQFYGTDVLLCDGSVDLEKGKEINVNPYTRIKNVGTDNIDEIITVYTNYDENGKKYESNFTVPTSGNIVGIGNKYVNYNLVINKYTTCQTNTKFVIDNNGELILASGEVKYGSGGEIKEPKWNTSIKNTSLSNSSIDIDVKVNYPANDQTTVNVLAGGSLNIGKAQITDVTNEIDFVIGDTTKANNYTTVSLKSGYAITLNGVKYTGDDTGKGEVVFDPTTGELISARNVLVEILTLTSEYKLLVGLKTIYGKYVYSPSDSSTYGDVTLKPNGQDNPCVVLNNVGNSVEVALKENSNTKTTYTAVVANTQFAMSTSDTDTKNIDLINGTFTLTNDGSVSVGTNKTKVQNNGNSEITVKTNDPESGKSSVTVPANGKVTIGDTNYNVGDSETKFVIDASGNITLSEGEVKLAKDGKITVGKASTQVENLGNTTMTVSANTDGTGKAVIQEGGIAKIKDTEITATTGEVSVDINADGSLKVVANPGKITIKGISYTGDVELSIDASGNVTVLKGSISYEQSALTEEFSFDLKQGQSVIMGNYIYTATTGNIKINGRGVDKNPSLTLSSVSDKVEVALASTPETKTSYTACDASTQIAMSSSDTNAKNIDLLSGSIKVNNGTTVSGTNSITATKDDTKITLNEQSVKLDSGAGLTTGVLTATIFSADYTFKSEAKYNVDTNGTLQLNANGIVTMGDISFIGKANDTFILSKENSNQYVTLSNGASATYKGKTIFGVEKSEDGKETKVLIGTDNLTLVEGKALVTDKTSVLVKTNDTETVSVTAPKNSTVILDADKGVVSNVKKGESVTIGTITYTSGEDNGSFSLSKIELTNKGDKVVVPSGESNKVYFGKNSSNEDLVIDVLNTNTSNVTVEKTEDGGKVTIARNGDSFEFGGKTYTANSDNAEFTISNDGTVTRTLSSGSLDLNDGEAVTGVSGKPVLNPLDSGSDTITVTADAEKGIDTVKIPANGIVDIDGTRIQGDSKNEVTIEISKDGTITVMVPKSGSVTIGGTTYSDTREATAEGDNIKVVIGSDGQINVVKPTPKTPTVPTITTELTYGDALSLITLTDGWAFVDGTIKPSVSDSEKTTYSITLKVDDTNYDWSKIVGYKDGYYTTTITVKINKAEVTDSVKPSIPTISKELTYGDTLSKIELTNDWTWVDGTIKPSVSDSQNTAYGIKVRVDSDNYDWSNVSGYENGYYVQSVKVTVNKATYDMSNIKFEDSSLTYDSKEHILVINETLPSGVRVSYEITDKNGNVVAAAVNAGEYTVVASFTGDSENYNTIADKTAKLTIKTKDIKNATVTLGDSLTYNGVEQTQDIKSVNVDKLNVTYKVSGNSATNAGKYTLVITASGNFSGTLDVKWSIAKASYDMSRVTFEGKTVVYDSNTHSLSIDESTLPSGVTVTYENNDKVDSGEYTVIAKFNGNFTNYNAIDDMSATLIIKKAVIENTDNNDSTTKPNVIVSEEGGTNPNVELSVTKEEVVPSEIKANVKRDEVVAAVYDISLYSEGVSIEPSGRLTIKLLIPDNANGKTFRILHLHEGDVRNIDYTIDGDYAIFSVTELSEFSIVVNNTGSATWLIIVLAIVVAIEIVLIAVKLCMNKRRSNKLCALGLFGGVIPVSQIVWLSLLSVLAILLAVYLVYLYMPKKNAK